MSLEKIDEVDNPLFGRKEITAIFSAGAGSLKRKDVANAIAQNQSVDVSTVFTIKMDSRSGSRKIKALLYLYENEGAAKQQLAKHIYFRNRPEVKEEAAKPEVKEEAAKPI